MSKPARSWSFWLAWAVLLSVAAGALYFVVRSFEKKSGRDDLKIEVAALRSQAATGQLLSEQAAEGKVTQNFLEEQAAQLHKNVEAARARLRPSDFSPDLRDAVERAGELAASVSEDVAALGGSSADARRAGSLKEEFGGMSSQLMSLEEALKQQEGGPGQ